MKLINKYDTGSKQGNRINFLFPVCLKEYTYFLVLNFDMRLVTQNRLCTYSFLTKAYLLIVSATSRKSILEVSVYPWCTTGSPSGPSQQSTMKTKKLYIKRCPWSYIFLLIFFANRTRVHHSTVQVSRSFIQSTATSQLS